MKKCYALIQRLLNKEEGASLAEYALLLFLITAALITIITAFGTQIGTVFTNATTALGS